MWNLTCASDPYSALGKGWRKQNAGTLNEMDLLLSRKTIQETSFAILHLNSPKANAVKKGRKDHFMLFKKY